jgi:hypothetical protein
MAELPTNASGKILKRKLREQCVDGTLARTRSEANLLAQLSSGPRGSGGGGGGSGGSGLTRTFTRQFSQRIIFDEDSATDNAEAEG